MKKILIIVLCLFSYISYAQVGTAVAPVSQNAALTVQQMTNHNGDAVYESLEDAMKKPLAVKHLILRGQGLTEIPNEVFEMVNLEVLDLNDNQIVQISKSSVKSDHF